MFYYSIKWLARCSLLFFFRKKITCGFSLHTLKGPAIIASNHPNSMLDAVVIACQCRQPAHFVIRSDMFNNPVFRFLLKGLNGIPVYRASEEKEKLKENFSSIAQCRSILKKNGIIIIFSEGITEHNWKLKPIKSGTARIVYDALCDEQLSHTLRVVPVGLTYSNYTHPAKTIIIHTGEAFYPGQTGQTDHPGTWKQAFNGQLLQKLHALVPDLETENDEVQQLWQIFITNITYKRNCNKLVKQMHHQGAVLSAVTPGTTLRHKLKRYFYPCSAPAITKAALP